MGTRLITYVFAVWTVCARLRVAAQSGTTSNVQGPKPYGLYYTSKTAITGAYGDQFNIVSSISNLTASCGFDAAKGGSQRPGPFPINIWQKCAPATFQFRVTKNIENCAPEIEVEHTVTTIDGSKTFVNTGVVSIPCPKGKLVKGGVIRIEINSTISQAPAGWTGDRASSQENNTGTYTGPTFIPTDFLNAVIANMSYVPGQVPVFYGCACNISYVSYGCCTAPKNQIVMEAPSRKLGSLELGSGSTSPGTADHHPESNYLNVKGPSAALTAAIPQDTKAPEDKPPVCRGYCYGSARICSWGYTGYCECGVSTSFWEFWVHGACVPTSKNPNKQHDKRGLRRRQLGGRGPMIHMDKPIGICNATYISHACANAGLDGIVHEPRSNWLGALLPEGISEYPPIPQEYLDIHGIKEQPDLGPLGL